MKLIAAADKFNGIGKKDGSLLFRIPEDMRRFKSLTTGNTVIVGRKTLESFPGGVPLPDRRCIVLSRKENHPDNGAEYCAGIEELRELLPGIDGEIFVIGGGEIYRCLMPLCDTAYITRIDADGGGEIFLPPMGELWRLTEKSEKREYEGISYWFETYERNVVFPSCLIR
ncbi:MAG: dihydrofolate reductase [bacterium]|nr:dihydrofolate reductase [bacterium]